MSHAMSEKIISIYSESLEEFIAALGRGIGTAQRELDRSSIEIQRKIDEDPLLSQYGLQATWYQMPKTELELKIAFSIQQRLAAGLESEGVEVGEVKSTIPRKILIEPINALYANQFGFNVSSASTVKLTIVPVPPPKADSALSSPRLSEENVRSKANPDLVKEQDGTTPVQDARINITFNPISRLWFVTQYREKEGKTEILALIVIDDETDTIIRRVRS